MEKIADSGRLTQMLKGELQTVLVHNSYQSNNNAKRSVEIIARTAGSEVGLGAVVNLQHYSPKSLANRVEQYADLPMRFVDPQLYKLPLSGWGNSARLPERKGWGSQIADFYLSPKKSSVKAVLDSQLEAGANVFLTASGWVTDINPTKALEKSIKAVDESFAVSESPESLFVNLALDSRWLSESYLRAILLNFIVSSTYQRFYLRFWWPEERQRYGQLRSLDILQGYKELVAICSIEEKVLYLPNVGLTGWLLSSFGLSGYSTGTSWGEQAFVRNPIVRRPKGRKTSPRLERIFDSMILHTVEYSEFERLRRLGGHAHTGSEFSKEIDKGAFSTELSGYHYLDQVVRLQRLKVTDKSPEDVVLRQIGLATKWLDTLPITDKPLSVNNPSHLPIWEKLF